MEIREFRPDDMLDLLELCREALPLDQLSAELLRRRILETPAYNPAYQLCAWQNERLIGAMLCGTRRVDQEMVAAMHLFAVDRQERRHGVASALLAELELRLRSDGLGRLKIGAAAPYYLWPGLDLRYTPAYCFLQRHGFGFQQSMVNMQVDLLARSWSTTDQEASLAQDGFNVERATLEQREPLSVWLREHWSDGWRDETLAAYLNNPVSAFIATDCGKICAFAAYNVAGFEQSFGPTGTLADQRGRGLGRVLFYRCMHDLRRLGHRQAEIMWVGPIAFYARIADATIHRAFWGLEKKLDGVITE